MTATVEVAQLIESRLREIEEQLRPFKELERERRRLQVALGALREDDDAPAPASAQRAAAPRARSAAKPRRGRGRGKRAARGSNLTAIIEHVTANPGATAGDIADATGISRGVVYSATSRLSAAGRLTREPRPDGQVAYHAPASR